MLNKYKPQTFVRFSAEVFMCQQRCTGNGLNYWNLRLITQGKMVDAFQWDNEKYPLLQFKENDGIMVLGRWTTKHKNRLQILQTRMVTPFAANDDVHNPNQSMQLELNLDSKYSLKKEA